MNQEHEVICPHCNEPSGYTEEGLNSFFIKDDLKCLRCGKVVVSAPGILYRCSSNESTRLG